MEPEILKRYFRGESSPREREAVLRWLGADDALPPPSSAREDAQSRAVLGARMWDAIAPSSDPAPSRARPARAFRRGRAAWATLAAALVLGIGTFTVFRSGAKSAPVAAAREYRVIKTADGQKAVLTLADGSRIHLNGGSEIRYPTDFSRGERDVRLEGEAFFEVARDTLRPFTVFTKDTRTRVLGTAFGLRAYPEDGRTMLAVRDGRVAFSAASDTGRALLLTKDQLASHRAGEDEARAEAGSAAARFAWMDGTLAFENESIEEMARVLERWYGVDIEIRSSRTGSLRFTGTYARPPLPALLEDMALTTGIRYKLDSRKLILY